MIESTKIDRQEKPFQFGLRTLLLVTAVCGVYVAVLKHTGPILLVLTLVAVIIFFATNLLVLPIFWTIDNMTAVSKKIRSRFSSREANKQKAT